MKSILGSIVLAGVALCGTGAAMAASVSSHDTTNLVASNNTSISHSKSQIAPGGSSPCPRPWLVGRLGNAPSSYTTHQIAPGGSSPCPRPWLVETLPSV